MTIYRFLVALGLTCSCDSAMKASNEFVALMEKRLVDLPDKEEFEKHLRTIQKLRAEADPARERDEQHSKEIKELKERLTLSEGDKVALRGDLDLRGRS